jgi:hypothetical protein
MIVVIVADEWRVINRDAVDVEFKLRSSLKDYL